MFIGLLQVELHLPASNSLKDKRSVIQSIIKRIQNKHNIAIAETEEMELHRKAILAATTISNSKQIVENTLRQTEQLIENTDGCEILESRIEFL